MRLPFRSARERFARNLQVLIDELDAGEWDRQVTSKVKTRADVEHDLRQVGAALRSSSYGTRRSNKPPSHDVELIDRMCAEYGVSVGKPDPMGDLETVGVDFAELRNCAMSEHGYVGTPSFHGRITKEPTAKYRPATVRGTAGNSGLYEKYWSSESQIYDAVQGHTELLASGAWAVQMPRTWPVGQRTAMEDFVAYHNRRLHGLRCQRGRWPTFVEHAASAIPIGFSIFEPVFRVDGRGRLYWAKAGFREPASVDKWWSNERGDDLVAVEFWTGGDRSRRYVLEAHDDPRLNHILLFGVGALGANWEGRPPTRPSLHWVKMKRLIAQIVPLAAEKYGVPISYLRADPQYLALLSEGEGLTPPDLDDAYEKFKDARAAEGPVFKFADGIIADVVSPPNEMPGLDGWIQYADQMIAFPFSNEGNLLGLSSATGSYAQAEVKERRFLRSAPAYARKISEPIDTHVLGPLARMEFGDELVEPPRLVYRPHSLMESGSWIANARQLFGPNLPVDKWPDEFREIAYEKMGTLVPGSDLDQGAAIGGDAADTAPAASEQDVAKSALNGAQVTSMVEVLLQVASGMLPAESAIRILMRAFQMDREVAEAMVMPSSEKLGVGDGSPSEDPAEAEVEESLDDAEESTDPIPPDLVSIREAAEALGVPTRTIGDMVRRREVRFWQFGNRKQVSLQEVLAAGAQTAVPDEEE